MDFIDQVVAIVACLLAPSVAMGGLLTVDDISLFWSALQVAPLAVLMDTGVLVVQWVQVVEPSEVLHFLGAVLLAVFLDLLTVAYFCVDRCRNMLRAALW